MVWPRSADVSRLGLVESSCPAAYW